MVDDADTREVAVLPPATDVSGVRRIEGASDSPSFIRSNIQEAKDLEEIMAVAKKRIEENRVESPDRAEKFKDVYEKAEEMHKDAINYYPVPPEIKRWSPDKHYSVGNPPPPPPLKETELSYARFLDEHVDERDLPHAPSSGWEEIQRRKRSGLHRELVADSGREWIDKAGYKRFLQTARDSIAKHGLFEGKLKEESAIGLVATVVENLQDSWKGKADICLVDAYIMDGEAEVILDVNVLSQGVEVQTRFSLKGDPKRGLVLDTVSSIPRNDKIKDSIVSRGVTSKLKEAMKDPNRVLDDIISKQLDRDGIELTGSEYLLHDSEIVASLEGREKLRASIKV